MQYRAGSHQRDPARIGIQDFQFTVLPNTSSFVNGPFTAPIEVPENTRAVGDSSFFDVIPADSISFHSIQLSGADADLFTARNSLVNNAGVPIIVRISLAFKNAPNFEIPQGGPDNNSNDYQVNITASGVSVNIIVRVTDEVETPSGITLRAVRVTPTTITIDWDEPVNTGPSFATYSVRLTQQEQGITRNAGVLASNARTFKYYLLTPNTEYEITVRVQTAEGGSTSNLVRVTTPNPLVPAFAADATIPDQLYLTERLIQPLTLPRATSGNGALTYALTGPNGETVSEAVPGLSFDPDTRVLSGTPTAPTAAPLAFTWTAADADDNTAADDTTTLEFSITVEVDSVPRFNRPQPGLAFLRNTFVRQELPQAVDGNGALTYAFLPLPRLPPGLTFDRTARPPTISGTPTALFAKRQFNYFTGDADANIMRSDSDLRTFNIAVVESFPEFFKTVADQRLSENSPFTLVLPDAGSGTTPRTFTLTGPNGEPVSEAVPGMRFAPLVRFLVGRPTTVATTTLTYTVTDANEATDTATFRVIVAPRVALDALDAPGNQTYTMDTEIPALTLPMATGGTGTLTYTLRDGSGNDVDGTDNAVPGLIFDRTARTLTGTPTEVTDGAVTLIYIARDINNGTASFTFDITVAEAVMVEAPDDQTYTMGTTVTALTLLAASGGTGDLTYTLTGPNGTDLSQAAPGLMWTGDATNPGTITGEPTATGATELTYTVTDENGSTASDTFTVTVAAAVALADTGDQTYTMGTEIPAPTLPMATGGTGTLTYTLRDGSGNDVDGTDNAVPGLIFDRTARTLTGTPTTQATTALTYTVTDDNGSTASDTFAVAVAAAVAVTAPDDQTYTMGQTITALTLPPATGGTGTLTYTLRDGDGNDVDAIDNAVPGLIFNTIARVLSGTPTTATTLTLTYTVTDDNGSTASATVDITVAARVAVTAPNDQTYTMGTGIPALTLPAATGGTGTLTYTLTGLNGVALSVAVPGLSFDDTATVRVLSGTPTTAATTALTYTVTDEHGSTDSATFPVAVAAAVTLADTGDQTYTMGQTITDLTLPMATGGTGTLTYTLTGLNGAALSVAVPGLSFDDTATARVLSGTPTTAATTALTYIVTDDNGSTASDTFDITVATGVALNAPNDQTYTMGQTITALTLPAATGGTGTLTYTLRDGDGNDVDAIDNAVPGLIFNTIARVLSGTPTTAATTTLTLTYTVTDDNGSTASDTFDITVAARVAVTAPNDQTYTMGTEIPAQTLPAATGGTGTLTYTLTGLNGVALSVAVPGLSFDDTATVRVLSGTPTTAATTALTYTVTDEHGSTDSATFPVAVAAAVTLADTGDQTYMMGTEIPDLTLPVASGGTGTLTYTLTGPGDAALSHAVPGLTFNTTARVLSGTPTTAATTALTYTATDQNGSTASATLTLTVAAAVAVTAPNDQRYTVGRPIPALTLPPARRSRHADLHPAGRQRQ